eukprot:gnl/TRDRNA2_/TRDRNA2_142485_c0_seq2.p1 gnl/TRDRNA2_/TRDRNA2_142485_c0~~gnl/TRDRNA2_/TRDRNA2_142485_c0_seq2.p1  ORF type:complete len:392 (-),score=19.47 gnl/TRDRNA2_/TRDRNA2_142485_c0_seq2:124-1152(-)
MADNLDIHSCYEEACDGDSESRRGDHDIHTFLQVNNQLAKAKLDQPSAPSLRWDAWRERFPNLTTPKLAWFALGNNKWMEYIDGRNHPSGQQAFDGAAESRRANQDGRFSYHIANAVDEVGQSLEWNQPWNVSTLASLNMQLRGDNCTESLCLNAFTDYEPQCGMNLTVPSFVEQSCPLVKVDCKDYRNGITSSPPAQMKLLYERKLHILETLIKKYYSTAKGASFDIVLPHLAGLLSCMAWLHPFGDANSRTRNLFMQSALTQSGGHPVALWNNGWWIYGAKSLEELQSYFKLGWCNWERILAKGTSPFIGLSVDHLRNWNQPAETSSYNIQSQECAYQTM